MSLSDDSIPDELRVAESFQAVRQVLEAPWDGTAKHWRVRNFFELDAVQEHAPILLVGTHKDAVSDEKGEAGAAQQPKLKELSDALDAALKHVP